jgi:exonuclease SbcC
MAKEKERKELEQRYSKIGGLKEKENSILELRKDMERRRRKLEKISGNIDRVKEKIDEIGFDEEGFTRIEEEVKQYQRENIVEEYSKAKTKIEALPKIKDELSKLIGQRQETEKRLREIESQINVYGRIEEEYKNAKNDHDTAIKTLSDLKVELERIKAKIEGVEKEIRELEKDKGDYEKSAKELETIEADISALEDLKNIFKQLPLHICERLRPYIEVEANNLLSTLSGEIYGLEIEPETMGISAFKGGERRVINYFSGGEKTRINMALRIAISRILSKLPSSPTHVFAKMRTLFIDEGDFGSLDEEGIRQAIKLLQDLTLEFDRVILISHVPLILETFQGNRIEVIPLPNEASKIKVNF